MAAGAFLDTMAQQSELTRHYICRAVLLRATAAGVAHIFWCAQPGSSWVWCYIGAKLAEVGQIRWVTAFDGQ
jgi:hypothetical protein